MTSRLTILVSGMIAGVPHHGGATWAVLQYVLGLRELGHRVLFVEPVDAASLRPGGTDLDASANAAYCAAVMDEVGLGDAWALVLSGTRRTAGLAFAQIERIGRRADVLINLSGMLDPHLAAGAPVRLYVDLDPGFTQLWHEVEGVDMGLDGHTHFVTVGLALGSPACAVPLCEREWITMPPPVALSHWPVGDGVVHDGLTTVANWRSHGSITHDGVHYGQKAHALRSLFALPSMTNERFVLALGIHPDERADLAALRRHGWELLEPAAVAGTPSAYRDFVRGSKAEFGLAKTGYVVSRGGWFSDRSACYLAAGRPVLAQETGFSAHLPTGEGLFSFADAEEVLTGIELLNGAYPRQSRAARALAEEYFDARRVLTRLLDEVGSTS